MPTALLGEILKRADVILQDNDVRWPLTELQEWLNDAYRAIVMVRPDANMQPGTYVCTANEAHQQLNKTGTVTNGVSTGGFPTALRLRAVVRNAETANKRAIRLIQQAVLDDQRPNWHAEVTTATNPIQHYIYDPLNPKWFYLYPVPASAIKILLIYSSVPTKHGLTAAQLTTELATPATVIQLDDIYVNPILDYLLYRAYAKDSEYAANLQRAQAHYEAFSSALGGSVQADSTMAPVDDSRSTGNHGAN